MRARKGSCEVATRFEARDPKVVACLSDGSSGEVVGEKIEEYWRITHGYPCPHLLTSRTGQTRPVRRWRCSILRHLRHRL